MARCGTERWGGAESSKVMAATLRVTMEDWGANYKSFHNICLSIANGMFIYSVCYYWTLWMINADIKGDSGS